MKKYQILKIVLTVTLFMVMLCCVVSCGEFRDNLTGTTSSEDSMPTDSVVNETDTDATANDTEGTNGTTESQPVDTYPEEGPVWSFDY